MSPISRRRGASRPAPPLVCRWDLDKTYLRSEFETIRQLLRTAFERGEDKVDVPGVAELIKVIREAADRRKQRCRTLFVSASPPQIGKAIRQKLDLDGVPYDGIVFKNQNVAYMVGLAFAIAASANFPAIVLSIFWRPLTTRGAQASMIVGALSALLLIYLSPTIQVSVLGHDSAPFPLKNPGLVSIPLAFVVGMVVSLVSPEGAAAEGFAEVQRRVHLGPEAEEA